MTATSRRVRGPAALRLPVEIPVPDLARASGMSIRRMLRRLRENDVVLRQRGSGTRRKHHFVTYSDLKTSKADWILEEIQNWNALLARHAPEPPPEDDDDAS